VDDPPVGGNSIAGAHLHAIARLQGGIIHLDERAVGCAQPCAAVRQASERADGFVRTDHAALLEHMPKNHDDGKQHGRHQIAQRPGAQHGNRNEEVRDAVQVGVPETVPARLQHGYGNDQ
jgi:hypothetical protein